MPDEQDELEPQHQQLPPDVQALLRQGRKAQRDLEAANAAVEAKDREVAVERAGIPESPMRDFFLQNYQGPTDPEAIKAEAEKLGLFGTSAAPAASGPTEQEMAAQRQILNATGGAPAASGDIDLGVAFRNTKSSAEVMAIVKEVAGTPGFRSRDGLIGVLPDN